ncbi:MAG: bifunctional phosphoglucose/phosphomannose isomerase [Candidatus Aenigmarchaeota archaeon]
MILDDPKEIERIDISKVVKVMDKFPEQCEEGIEIGRKFVKKLEREKPGRVCVCGMGGSGIAGDILAGAFPDRDIRVFKGYELPKYIGKGDLVFAVSYSGNTEETLSVFREAERRGYEIIAVTSGGELERECVKHSIDYVKIPKGIKPRFSLGYLLFPIIVILEKIKFLKKQKLDLVVKNLRETREEIWTETPAKDNPAKRIAMKLVDSVPVVQGFGIYEPIAYRTRTQFNENSKIPSFSENFPELDHNSILGWEGGGYLTRNFSVILIRDDKEGGKIWERIEFTKKLLRKSVKYVVEVWSLYPHELSRMLSTMYVLDFVTVYLGLLRNKDPGDDSLLLKLKTILKKGE